jgi:hypothetical protein
MLYCTNKQIKQHTSFITEWQTKLLRVKLLYKIACFKTQFSSFIAFFFSFSFLVSE